MEKKNSEKTVFSKKALLAAKHLKKYRDIISAIVKDGEELELSEAENRIQKYLKRSV